jgi:lipid-A-disaccharide synthase
MTTATHDAPSDAPGATTPAAAARVLMIAGEASGDLHGADLLRALRARVPHLEVFGIGGAGLRAAGMQTIVDAGEVATVGVVEAAAHLRQLYGVYRELVRGLREKPPALCILIDFPEFNLRLARAAKRAGIPVLYYIGPQVWAWRRGRVRTIARRVDRLAVVFPFEPALYSGRECAVEFVGHPLLDRVAAGRPRAATRAAHGFADDRPLVLLLPGSRRSEIERILPAMLDAVRMLAADASRQFVLGLAPTVSRDAVEALVASSGVPVSVVAGETYDLMAAADLAIVASGTATLECALLECPMVVVYRMAPLTYAIARMLVRGVRHIAMPNIVAEREIVPELIQHEADAPHIAATVRSILETPGRRAAMVADLRAVRAQLGRGGAAARAADIAAEMLAAGRG